PPRSAGLYVLLMPDTSWGPWPFQPLHFGEFGLQHESRMTAGQQACCLKVAAGRSLYVAVYVVPRRYEWAAPAVKKELIERYRPLANLESLDTTIELAYRLHNLENKITEQDAMLKLALATIGQIAQLQQPEPRKRIAGFRPQPPPREIQEHL